MAEKRIRAVVEGRVQGVFFRAHTQEKAQELGLVGWVRNRPDGSVETVAEGEAVQVDHLAEWLQHGPSAARVAEARIREEGPKGEFHHFEIHYH
mgnify:CR=1 FL=1